MFYNPILPVTLLAAVSAAVPVFSATLFFNCAPDGGSNNGNFLDCSNCRAAGGVNVYDNLNVTGSGWLVDALYGDYRIFSATRCPPTPVGPSAPASRKATTARSSPAVPALSPRRCSPSSAAA